MDLNDRIEKEYCTDSVNTFVSDEDLYEKFERMTGKKIDKYENDESDDVLICRMMEYKYPNNDWLVDYIDDGNTGHFHIRIFRNGK